MLALAAYYAPRGIPPAHILGASPSELAFLDESRKLHNKEIFAVIHNAICAALNEDAAKEAQKIYG